MKYQRQTRGRSERAIPQSGAFLLPMPGDRSRYESMVTYTPERLTSIMSAANSGDIEQLAICAREIMERNWDVIGAMEQRADAISGVKWDVVPGGTGDADKAAAKAFAAELAECGELNGYDTFYDLIRIKILISHFSLLILIEKGFQYENPGNTGRGTAAA